MKSSLLSRIKPSRFFLGLFDYEIYKVECAARVYEERHTEGREGREKAETMGHQGE